MSDHTVIRMVERADGSGYDRRSTAAVERLLELGTVRMEGADGDEIENTVTYWYCRSVEQ